MDNDIKFSIIMPTYNDGSTIVRTLDSIINQKYSNWELIISNDGSTDNTEEIVKKYINEKNISDKVKYFKYENGDQNNAILRVLKYINGEYIYILHSDDVFYDEFVLKKANDYLKENSEYDAIISDIQKVNKFGENIGIQKTREFKREEYLAPKMLLWLGRNLFLDFGFFKKDSFLKKVLHSYLNWNIPFWIDYDSLELLNVKKVDFIFFKYTISEENYINNEIGKLNVINGEIRIALSIMKKYNIPIYKLQYFIFRLLNKLNLNYIPIYNKKETEDIYEILKFIVLKRYNEEEIQKYISIKNLLTFFRKYKSEESKNNVIVFDKIPEDEFLYLGKDIRKFNNDMLNKSISGSYMKILEAMEKGFSKIIVKDEEDMIKVKNILKFFAIDKYVIIEIE